MTDQGHSSVPASSESEQTPAKHAGRTGLTFIALGVSLVAIVLASVALVERSGTQPTTNAVTASMVQAEPGVYKSIVPSGYPYYFVILNDVSGTRFNGSMNFRYSDGQASVVFAFTGVGVNENGTVEPTAIPQAGSASENASSLPKRMAVTFQSHSVSFGQCMEYLHFTANETECSFRQGSTA